MANPYDYNFTGVYDLIGNIYNKGGFTSYLNGIKLTDEDFLQLGSIVSNIETGLEPCVEFNSPQTEIFIDL